MMWSGACLWTTVAFFATVETHHETLCKSPDRPTNGIDLDDGVKRFEPGDDITYTCKDGYVLMGEPKNKCLANGEWSQPTPFCDNKVDLEDAIVNNGTLTSSPEAIDRNPQSCSSLATGGVMKITLKENNIVVAVSILLEGRSQLEVKVGSETCANHNELTVSRRWIRLKCSNNSTVAPSTNLVKITEQSPVKRRANICEVQVYAREGDSCAEPPQKRVPNGYFEVARSLARLRCDEGFNPNNSRTRLTCEKRRWSEIGQFECKEILCQPSDGDGVRERGVEWIIVDRVSKLSVGTRKELRCEKGYKKVGGPFVLRCERNGTWTWTNATCKEILCSDSAFKPSVVSGTGTWIPLDGMRRNSVGAKRQLECGKGQTAVGQPQVVWCREDGQWTSTNATCKEEKMKNSKDVTTVKSSTLIILIVVGVVVSLIIVALIGTTCYFVRKQRGKEVVVVYSNPPTDGSVVSGSDNPYASGFYETIQDEAPPANLQDGYFLPVDAKGTLIKKTTPILPILPAELAFNSLAKHCQLYK